MKHQANKYGTYILLLLTATLQLTSSCSEHSVPDSQEPTLSIGTVTDITRTEATVSATIERHGGANLSYVTLHYKADSKDRGDELIIEGDPKLSAFTFRLTDLYPGTQYICHLKAGTATASLESEPISFTTLPNDPPSVSGITPLSTGPLGIMVAFNITDDGGEKIIEAGCELKEAGHSESFRLYATHQPFPERIQLSITGLTPGNTYTITPFASNSRGESTGEPLEYTTSNSVVLTEPGMLSRLFGNDDSFMPDLLVISGPMNGDDFRTLRAMLGSPDTDGRHMRISGIDLSDAVITEGGNTYDGQHFTVANRVTTGMFADCLSLSRAILPNTATAIERDAFAHCHVLETLRLPASAKTIIPSSDCPKLQTIEVPLANTSYTSFEGVLLNADSSEIIWFPCGKTGEYIIPSTITAIRENAFAGTSITSLIIPSTIITISRGAFSGSALKEIGLPDNITNISEGMFQNCTTLTTVILGAGTDFIGDYAFDGTDLTDLYIRADYPPYTTEDAFTNRQKSLTEKCTLHVPIGSRNIYRNHSKWGKFTKIEEFQL